MQIIISPAKKMQTSTQLAPLDQPYFQDQANYVRDQLRRMSVNDLQQFFACSEAIAKQAFADLKALDFDFNKLTPAILAFNGLQYQSLDASSLDQASLAFLQDHLYILDAFYGILRPFDGIQNHRLDMNQVIDGDSLYTFWGDRLADLALEDGLVLNLASQEYAKAILPYANEKEVITVTFKQQTAQGYQVSSPLAKKARGLMVRFIAQNKVAKPDQLKTFTALGLSFNENLSSANEMVFTD
ncbi:hypothetical protein SAMN05216431_11819 [Ligilactobacillus sp. WC1T17]|uniref:UPF0246 protein SAMN05216431_11819 n=1 Tax=Ligilactobacillus ruminis TaxID=1623 RepID=A0ABY1AEJ2_9LACO|nr:hypothetical protein SAMN05216431_11819 [Ligilactobacillus ruminis]